MTDEKKYCAHRKVDNNQVCPDCHEFVALYDKYDRKRQSFRFNENGEFVEVFRGSEWAKEGWEVAGSTEGVYERRRY